MRDHRVQLLSKGRPNPVTAIDPICRVRAGRSTSLLLAVVLLARCAEVDAVPAPACELEYRLDDGSAAGIPDGGRAPGEFGSQGALMVIVGVHGIPALHDEPLVVTADFETNLQPRASVTMRRRATTDADGISHIDDIVLVIEQVALHFDKSIPRTVDVTIDVESETGACAVSRQFGVDIVGEPYRPPRLEGDSP